MAVSSLGSATRIVRQEVSDGEGKVAIITDNIILCRARQDADLLVGDVAIFALHFLFKFQGFKE